MSQWSALLCSCCNDDQPLEMKVAAAKALVSCADSVLTNPHLPLGLSRCSTAKNKASGFKQRSKWSVIPACLCTPGLTNTVSLWRSLFTLLQDEDQDVRAAAADFLSVPTPPAGDVACCPTGEFMPMQNDMVLLVVYSFQWTKTASVSARRLID